MSNGAPMFLCTCCRVPNKQAKRMAKKLRRARERRICMRALDEAHREHLVRYALRSDDFGLLDYLSRRERNDDV